MTPRFIFIVPATFLAGYYIIDYCVDLFCGLGVMFGDAAQEIYLEFCFLSVSRI